MDANGNLEIGFPQLRYDITMPICDGRVPVDGITLRPERIGSMVFKDVPVLREGNFGLADLNLGYLLAAIEAGWRIKALPVFTKRKGALQFIFCRKEANIAAPGDLEGKRVGTRQYRTALTLWARGLLAEHYGVDPAAIHWLAQTPEVFPNHDEASRIDYIPAEPGMVDRFFAGEVDALMTDISDAALLERLEGDPAIHRLFPDYQAEDARLFDDAGFFTPVHIIVMSADLAEAKPGLDRRLYDAFVEAKAMARNDSLSDRAGFAIAYQREAVRAEEARFGDLFPYGIAANRAAIDAMVRYSASDGATTAPLALECIFAESTLDT
jgi:4,5-dihydroxyphthalate decarboxylase